MEFFAGTGLQVLALSEHNLGAVEANGLHLQTDLPFAGFGQRQVFELEYFSGARFMEAKIFGMADLLNFSPW